MTLFLVVVFSSPVRFRTPEPLRLRYCSLQDGVRYGPLTSAWEDFEWRKIFDWEAGDTEYRPRPVAQMFEVLTPRIHVRLWKRFGPFLWYPFDLLLTFLIGLMILLLVRSLTGNSWMGLIGAAFWLTTVEVLVGFFFPVRSTKSLATLEFLICLYALARLRGRTLPGAPGWGGAFHLCLLLGLFTDEYGYLACGVYAGMILWDRQLKKVRLPLLVGGAVMVGVSVAVVFFWLPKLGYNAGLPPFAFTKTRETLAGLVTRNVAYGIANTGHVLKGFMGWFGARGPLTRGLVAGSWGVLIWVFIRSRAWRGLAWPGMATLFLGVLAGFVLLPAGTDILYQYTYYNRPLTALLCVLTGCAGENIVRRDAAMFRWWLGVLLVPALFSARFGWLEVNRVQENNLARYGIDRILDLERRVNDGELTPPIYLAYPRPLDPGRAVWRELRYRGMFTMEEEPSWLLYRYLTPLLYLGRFEEGSLLADPGAFKVWSGTEEGSYLDRAATYYDLPDNEAWELAPLKESDIGRARWPAGIKAEAPGFWGFPERIELAPGTWTGTAWNGFSGVGEASLAVVVKGPGRLRVSREGNGWSPWRELSCEWAYELAVIGLGTVYPGQKVDMELEVPRGAVVLGPAILPASLFEVEPLRRRSEDRFPLGDVPPACYHGDGDVRN